jgi:hypothetical protein
LFNILEYHALPFLVRRRVNWQTRIQLEGKLVIKRTAEVCREDFTRSSSEDAALPRARKKRIELCSKHRRVGQRPCDRAALIAVVEVPLS